MDFRILGPLEVVSQGRALDLGGQKRRAVLALLLVEANRAVSSDRLIEALWEGEPPETARKGLQEHPFRERPRRQLLLALYRSGRQADALASYQDARRTLVEELGIEPGKPLRDLHQAILRQDAELDLETDGAEPPAVAPPPVPTP